jgi:hypothetical protein
MYYCRALIGFKNLVIETSGYDAIQGDVATTNPFHIISA